MLTAEQILALAPDAASAKAGSGQANLSYWSQLGANEEALWGLCQGSGKEPYRTQIELGTPAFKCSCPSRKFPCKHGLGLYLLYAKQKDQFQHAQPEWVSEWLKGREQRQEKKASKAEETQTLTAEDLASREKSAQKRQDKRETNVANGIALLETWLSDLATEGLAGLRAKPASAWEAMAARMIDAQAAGLATRIRDIGMLIYGSSQTAWEIPVAGELGKLSLLLQTYKKMTQTPELLTSEQQIDVRTAIGWVASQEDALKQNAYEDHWLVLGNDTHHEARLSRRACYLWGMRTNKTAMLLQFAAGGQSLPSPYLTGSVYQGGVHFYPSATPLRAQVGGDLQRCPEHIFSLEKQVFSHQLQWFAEQLAVNPFIDALPIILSDVRTLFVNQLIPKCTLITPENEQIMLAPQFKHSWHLHALSGGATCTIFGLWNGLEFMPLSVLAAAGLPAHQQIHSFDTE
jgi:hypothetical protein